MQRPRGDTGDDRAWCDVAEDDRARADDGSGSDRHVREDDCAGADRGLVADANAPAELRTREDDGARPDDAIVLNARAGVDEDTVGELRLRADVREREDLHGAAERRRCIAHGCFVEEVRQFEAGGRCALHDRRSAAALAEADEQGLDTFASQLCELLARADHAQVADRARAVFGKVVDQPDQLELLHQGGELRDHFGLTIGARAVDDRLHGVQCYDFRRVAVTPQHVGYRPEGTSTDSPRHIDMARVVLGLPMYGSERSIGDVLESLLALDYDDYAVVALDDCSLDRTLEIAQSYATRDERLVVEGNPQRLGMIGNWNRVLERAYALFPELEYYAWTSDNDLRDPAWISTLVHELEADPAAALAYSRFGMIENGEKIVRSRSKWVFDTRGITSPRRRFVATMEGVRAGPTMYGLHRRSTLERAGNVPPVLLSDFVFLSHLSLYGQFVQAEEVLWYRDRHQMTGSSTRRQRAALFAEPPFLTYLPVPFQHAIWLFRHMVIEGRRPPGVSRVAAASLSVAYLANWASRLGRRGWNRVEKRRRKGVKRRRKRVERLKRRVLQTPVGYRVWRAVRSRVRR